MDAGRIVSLLAILSVALIFFGCTGISGFTGGNGTTNETTKLCPPGCSAHGTCVAGTCICTTGWAGINCSVESTPPTTPAPNTTPASTPGPPAPGGCTSDEGCRMNQFCNTTTGTCICKTGWMDCDMAKDNGCEANVLTSATNCGTCGKVCSGDKVCSAGACASLKKPDGTACTSDGECAGGNCYPALAGKRCAPSGKICPTCQVIDDAGTSCTDAMSETDPKDECPATAKESCGTRGGCDGMGECLMWGKTAVCSPGSCSNNRYASPGKCSGTGDCISGSISSCDDDNDCTTDECNPTSGCTHTRVSCDDGNECTVDSCSPNAGCVNTPAQQGTACTNGVCEGTACVPTNGGNAAP